VLNENRLSGKGFGLGDRTFDSRGNSYVYCKSSAALTQYDVVHISSAYLATPLTRALAATSGFFGVAPIAWPSASNFGFIQVGGIGNVRVEASAAKDVPLYTTSVAGSLDDATSSANDFQLMGILLTTNNGASASNTLAIINAIIPRLPRGTGST
jgi:hypothetical protein